MDACSKYVERNRLCRSEEGEPWDGIDQTVLFQVDVSFLYACARQGRYAQHADCGV